MSFVQGYAPNRKTIHVTTSTASWRVVASDASLHTDLSAMATAGKVPFPGLDSGMISQWLLARSENGSGAAGSSFYMAMNRGSAPTDDEAYLVDAAQGVDLPGPVKNVWIRKTTAGDEVILVVGY